MKANDPRINTQELNLTSDNTFIATPGSDFELNIQPFLSGLDAEKKTVVISDEYFFPTPSKGGDATYYQKLIKLLLSLKCQRIVYTNHPGYPTAYQQVQVALAANGIVLDNIVTTTPIHDRYWICPESRKGFTTGTSPNGMAGKLSQINWIPVEDVDKLTTIYKTENVYTE